MHSRRNLLIKEKPVASLLLNIVLEGDTLWLDTKIRYNREGKLRDSKKGCLIQSHLLDWKKEVNHLIILIKSIRHKGIEQNRRKKQEWIFVR